MGNRTKVSTLILGGALALVFLILAGPWIVELRGGEPIPTGAEGAFTILFAAVLAWILPDGMRQELETLEPPANRPAPVQLPKDLP